MLSTCITSLVFIRNDNILVAAKGSYICFYNTLASTLISSFKVFEKETISLIVVSAPNILLVAGNTQLQLWELDEDLKSKRIDTFNSTTFRSRVLDCKLMPNNDQYCSTAIAIAFAHNFIEIRDYSTSNTIYRAVCEDRCFLYSAKLFGNWDSLVMGCGTVWSGVHLWNVFDTVQGKDLDSSICYGRVFMRLTGHEGSVFDLGFNEDGTKLVSCSDDRSIRVWDLNDSSAEPVVLFYGHESRVWKVVFKDNLIYSVSEDASCRVWDINSKKMIECWQGHLGKSVWSVAVGNGNVCATGGEDGGVRLWSRRENAKCVMYLSEFPAEVVKSFCFLDTTDGLEIVSVSNKGRIALSRVEDDESLFLDPSISGYSSVSSIRVPNTGDNLIAVCSLHGGVILGGAYRRIKMTAVDPSIIQGKIDKMFLLKDSDEIVLVTHNLGSNSWALFHVLLSGAGFVRTPSLEPWRILELPVGVIIMSFVIVAGYALVGTRGGVLLVFDLGTSELVFREEGLHGKDAVTDICILADESCSGRAVVRFLSCGRDGFICDSVLTMSRESHAFKLETISRFKPCRWIEKIIKRKSGEVIFVGFSKQNIQVHLLDASYSTSSLLYSIPNITATMQWDMSIATPTTSRFAVIKAGNVVVYTNESLYPPVLVPSFRGLETRCVQLIGRKLLSGGEDGTLRVHDCVDHGLSLISCRREHESVILSAAICEGLLFTSGAMDSVCAWEGNVHDGFKKICFAPTPFNDFTLVRVMDVSAAKLSDGGYLVAGGCSDGILRVWIYAKNEFKLMRSLDNHGRCVLKVNLAEVSRDSYCLVSAATDGRVLCWRIDGTDVADEPCVMYQAHQSGVNGMDVRVDEGVMNVLSCGDDCSVSIFAVGVDEWCLRDHGCVELAHTSNATGVCFLSVDQFVSCSVDQDIHVWRIGRGDACVIEKVRTIETCVPDICDMSVSKDEDGSVLVAVSGMGAQLIKL